MMDENDPLTPTRRNHPLSILLSWMEAPAIKSRWVWLLLIGAIALALVDLIYHRHAYFGPEELPGFYGITGFFAFGLIVLSAWPLRILLSRASDYYAKRRERG